MKRLWISVLGLSTLGSWGCAQSLINTTMVYSPHKMAPWARLPDPGPVMQRVLGVSRQYRIPVGPPSAELRVWIVDPAGVPRGTIFCLHGYRNNAGFLLGTGHRLAQAGYRVVLVDLRGHGGSTGDYISYGVIESQDLVQVLDELERRDEIVGPVGVWGISMGASTAIQFAGRDERIKAVVAVVPYVTLRGEILGLTRRGLFFLGWMMSLGQIQTHIDAAAAEAGFDPDDVDAGAAMQRTAAKTLVFGARWMRWCRMKTACDWLEWAATGPNIARWNGPAISGRCLIWAAVWRINPRVGLIGISTDPVEWPHG